ncbi:M23 family metallopeptidase [Sulfuricurvum sp.]|uniref:M23 family metallopeptidase n=1 Tax=Sulfuricurvum sp. TaxID=2025608 RepID=UPI002E342DCF|nr:M23 family metallopeptidase [Sulfuricurvum sp.]HEX5329172.1 M23 family metallopeptidase [Sulfuricurvum sp.]
MIPYLINVTIPLIKNSGSMMRVLVILGLFVLALFADVGYNGKSIILSVPSPSGTITTPEMNISVLSHPIYKTQGIAILPIDYYAAIGDTNLTWIAPGKTSQISLHVEEAIYPTETLSVDPAKVTPPSEALEQIERERVQAKEIYARFTPIRYWDKAFIKPLESNITSEYGSKRTYNETLKSYHGGVDFRARTPIPIQATNNGIVVLAEDRYYSGGTIIIDHGEGIYSCYFHLSRYDVKVGDYVKQGDTIALSGDTGRITGPHLHFGFMVHGIQTDPLDLIEKINTLFR